MASLDSSIDQTELETLEVRREDLCLKFAKSCVKHPQMKVMFPLNQNKSSTKTRNPEKFQIQPANTDRLGDSAIPYMQRLLNKYGI